MGERVEFFQVTCFRTIVEDFDITFLHVCFCWFSVNIDKLTDSDKFYAFNQYKQKFQGTLFISKFIFVLF